jgi:hypothetical protein
MLDPGQGVVKFVSFGGIPDPEVLAKDIIERWTGEF